MWKWIHTSTCPDIQEYGSRNKLSEYCVDCLLFVWYESSSDWRKASYVKRIIKSENCRIRSLQQHCIKQIIERNIQFTHLPNLIKNQIHNINKDERSEI